MIILITLFILSSDIYFVFLITNKQIQTLNAIDACPHQSVLLALGLPLILYSIREYR